MLQKPEQWASTYGDVFQDRSVAQAYHHRPPYPAEVYDILVGLIPSDHSHSGFSRERMGPAKAEAFDLPQSILWNMLKDFELVSDGEIMRAMVWMIERAHTLAEAAGAAPLAAAYRMRDELSGMKVGLVCSGGNTSLEHLKRALAAG